MKEIKYWWEIIKLSSHNQPTQLSIALILASLTLVAAFGIIIEIIWLFKTIF
jgi:hypothetical protein